MKRVCGFAMFWFALGLFAMMILSSLVWGTILGIACLIGSYRLFCC